MKQQRTLYYLAVFAAACLTGAFGAAAFAAPVTLPSLVAERSPKIELFKYKDASLPRWFEDVRGTIGIEIDYAGERNIERKDDFTSDYEIVETTAMTASMLYRGTDPALEAQFYTVELGLAVNNRVDVYANLGWVKGVTYHSGGGGNTKLEFEDTFTYGGGITFILFRLANGLQLFSDVRYRRIDDFEAHKVYWPTGTASYSGASHDDEKSLYEERQIALGLSKGFGFEEEDQNHSFLFYGGAKYSQIDFKAKGYAIQQSGTLLYDLGPFRTKEPVGAFAGVTYVSSPGRYKTSGASFSIDLQVRVIDELGISLNLKNRF